MAYTLADLTPLDFCMWGYLKDKVHCIPYTRGEELQTAILQDIEEMPIEMVKDARMSLKHR